MATLVPFRALRPVPDVAASVAAVPYDVVDAEEARAQASGNPLSFLHVSRAEVDLSPTVDPHADEVYTRATANFASLRAQAPLVLEDAPRLYVYRLRMGDHEQTGVAGCFSVDEYDHDVIKKHERTRRDKEDDRTRHILALRAQTGPVFLTYRASAVVDGIVARATRQPPLFAFGSSDGVRHTLWQLGRGDQPHLVEAFQSISTLYIADGHHRAASASRARRHLAGAAHAAGEWDHFLAVAFPDDQVQVLPYNRVVTDLAALTPEGLLARLRERFTVREGPATPARRGEVGMFLGGRWHMIGLDDPAAGVPPDERLDVSRLQDAVLAPLLHIGDVRSDTRIDFVGGARGTGELERLVNSGRFAVAFSMYPVSVDDLMAISDAGGIMPPKSTWFEPKLKDGLLSHLI